MQQPKRVEAIRCPSCLSAAFQEAKLARRARALNRAYSELLPSGRMRDEAHLQSARSKHSLERLLDLNDGAIVDLGRHVSRFATLAQLSSRVISVMMTSVAGVEVDSRTAQGLVVILRELVHGVEAIASPSRPVRLYLAVARENGRLVVGLACPEAALVPVPNASAAEAFDRASRIADLMGGCLVRGIKDGVMVYGLLLDGS